MDPEVQYNGSDDEITNSMAYGTRRFSIMVVMMK